MRAEKFANQTFHQTPESLKMMKFSVLPECYESMDSKK